MRIISRYISLALFLLFFSGLLHVTAFLHSPPTSEKRQIIFEISPGMTLHEVASSLYQKGLVTNRTYFVALGKLIGIERGIRAGDYALQTTMLPLDLLSLFKKGRVIVHRVTIPEGSTAHQIATLLAQRDLTDYGAFMKLVQDTGFTSSLGVSAPTLEGYLFPDTYFFHRQTPPQVIIRRMVTHFQKVYEMEWSQQPERTPFSQHESVTLASIIEKETSIDSERPLISSVLYNRIKKGIPLQSDPTVIYALPDFRGNLTRADLSFPSPYNTYIRQGLPPGPISNPGRRSLSAVLSPVDSSYLYFVSKGNGTHYFSETLSEHNRAVERYQKRKT